MLPGFVWRRATRALHKKYEIGFFSVRPLCPLCLRGEETRQKPSHRVKEHRGRTEKTFEQTLLCKAGHTHLSWRLGETIGGYARDQSGGAGFCTFAATPKVIDRLPQRMFGAQETRLVPCSTNQS